MKIIIFGATGSIGQSTLEVIRAQNTTNSIQVLALTGNNNVEQLCGDAIEFGANRVVTPNNKHLPLFLRQENTH